ncbi:ABC transporter permease [Corynebacterium aquatimens]|uniref:ABC transport system permease protein n=1 Tax=Corynebacterium aquatimens TaxID=1190508 RepID=A0A931E2A0_9CORY|nr:ABC transporter permease [Corynebacterium aquatimens]MBG6122260.1 putative ABC transport system permease protein [Corynebacterium aquatimens]WJY65199.1 ABC transporter permease YtrF precursor [Corynebacterium aquatimens]
MGALTKVSLRNVGAHKLRLALTVLAVVLGTAFISGSMMFTNMLERTFDSAVSNTFSGVDAAVEPAENQVAVPVKTVDKMRQSPLIDDINIIDSVTVVVAREDLEPVQTGGASQVSVYYPEDRSAREPLTLTEGAAPKGAKQAIINADGALKHGISVGDEIIVVDTQTRHTFTVVGLYEDELGTSGGLKLLIDEPTYLDFYSPREGYPSLAVSAVEGTTSAQLVSELRGEFPDLKIEEGQVVADRISKEIRNALSFISYFLIAFGLVGLLVGTFLIANTFSMIVAQRTKEFALLRALGAAQRQITRSVVVEAVIVGVIGSAVGVVAGLGIVSLIRAIMERQGAELPGAGLGLSWDAVVIPILVGLVVTVLSAWAPARRAGRVQPVEAMRSSEAAAPQPLKVRTIIGAILLAAGAAFVAWGVSWEDGSTGNRASLVGVAAVCVIVGLFLAGPALSLPIVPGLGRVLGAPFGAVGSLAATNSKRNPRRVAATAFALMLGIALVTVIGMLGATMQRSVDDVLENEVNADYVMYGPQMGSFPIPADLPERVAKVDGVTDVMSNANAPLTVNGKYEIGFGGEGVSTVLSGDPAKLLKLDVVEGVSDLSGGGVLMNATKAEEMGVKVGQEVEIAAPGVSPKKVKAPVVGLFGDSNILSGWAIAEPTAKDVLPPQMFMVAMVGVNNDGSVTDEQLRINLENAVKQDIVVQVYTAKEVGGEASKFIDQMLSILYALLSLAVVIAILGIVNTLTLSVIERRQEIGMLRAVGTRRGQVRRMIVLESVQIAIFGALLGIVTGLILGWAFLTVLKDQGLENIAIPWTMLAVVLVSSVVVGLVAAVWPAVRAARTPPLDAIVDEN